jgi:hypothetical protein
MSYMQIIYMGTHWIIMWLLFQKEEEHKLLQDAVGYWKQCQRKYLSNMNVGLVID